MKKLNFFIVGVMALCLTSCIPPAYYLSPFNTNSNYYHTIPLKSDSLKAATYANATLLGGGANYHYKDAVSAFQGSIYRSNNFGRFQAYYGAGITLGTYSLQQNDIYTYHYNPSPAIFPRFPIQDSVPVYFIPAASKFFGAYGFNGGIDYVIPLKHGGEWRIGIETSLNNEIGDYLSFRKSLPDSLIDIVEKSNWTKTLGGYSDIIFKIDNTISFGYKIALGSAVISRSSYLGNQNNITPTYFSQTFHLTDKKLTGFLQFNLGTHSASAQLGINYKLSKK